MAQLMFVNKKRRGTKGRKATTKARRKTSHRRKSRRSGLGDWPNNAPGHSKASVLGYKRRGIVAKRHVLGGLSMNPMPRMSNILGGLVMPAAMSAVGALALDVAYGYLPLPPAIKSGPVRYLAKGVGAVALGMVVGMVNKRFGHNVAMGGLTVTLHSAMRDTLAQFAPGVALGAYADDMAAIAFENDGSRNLGYQESLGFQEPMGGVNEDYTQSLSGEDEDAMSSIDYD